MLIIDRSPKAREYRTDPHLIIELAVSFPKLLNFDLNYHFITINFRGLRCDRGIKPEEAKSYKEIHL